MENRKTFRYAPKPAPILTGEEALRFEEYDSKPLTEEEKAAIHRAVETYRKIRFRED